MDTYDLGGLAVLAGLACVMGDQQLSGQLAARVSTRGEYGLLITADDRSVAFAPRVPASLTGGLFSLHGSEKARESEAGSLATVHAPGSIRAVAGGGSLAAFLERSTGGGLDSASFRGVGKAD